MAKISIKNLDLYYSDFKALKNVNLDIEANKITAFIGPSGCGKSTLLKSLNRMNDLVEGCKIEGEILLDNQNIYKSMDVNLLRKRVGMVFQKPNPFPMSIYDNIAFGPRTHGIRSKAKLDDIVEKSLRDAAIWEETKDRLKKSALGMSGGQQQRLCIARALAVQPEVLLMDEPTNGLDIPSKEIFRKLLVSFAGEEQTVIISTHQIRDLESLIDAVIILNDKKIILNNTLDEISEKLFFRQTEPDEKVFYRTSTPLGTIGVGKNCRNEETPVSLELLFNAAISQPEAISSLFTSKRYRYE